tara:strand:+ start:316 stop:477 length:162 start_codon:yes stop_codon:yes gene_type:complete
MPNPNALWEDMEKLNAMYEELMWDPDDELDFSVDYTNDCIVIRNKARASPKGV